jgi:hypothetical protein
MTKEVVCVPIINTLESAAMEVYKHKASELFTERQNKNAKKNTTSLYG